MPGSVVVELPLADSVDLQLVVQQFALEETEQPAQYMWAAVLMVSAVAWLYQVLLLGLQQLEM